VDLLLVFSQLLFKVSSLILIIMFLSLIFTLLVEHSSTLLLYLGLHLFAQILYELKLLGFLLRLLQMSIVELFHGSNHFFIILMSEMIVLPFHLVLN
jgi:hypothetical protein